MNESRDLRGADKLTKHLDRVAWREQAVKIYTHGIHLAILQAIVAAGVDEFERVARPGFHGQGFKQEDLHYIFHRIRQHVAEKERDRQAGVVDFPVAPAAARARETGVIVTEVTRGEEKRWDG